MSFSQNPAQSFRLRRQGQIRKITHSKVQEAAVEVVAVVELEEVEGEMYYDILCNVISWSTFHSTSYTFQCKLVRVIRCNM